MNDEQISSIKKTEFIEHLRKGVRYVGNYKMDLSDVKSLISFGKLIPSGNMEGRILLNNNPGNLKMERVDVGGMNLSSKYTYLNISGKNNEVFQIENVLIISDKNDPKYLTLYLIDHE